MVLSDSYLPIIDRSGAHQHFLKYALTPVKIAYPRQLKILHYISLTPDERECDLRSVAGRAEDQVRNKTGIG